MRTKIPYTVSDEKLGDGLGTTLVTMYMYLHQNMIVNTIKEKGSQQ